MDIPPNGIFSCHKTNTTTITSIILHLVSGKVCLLNRLQAHQTANTTVFLLNKSVPASVRMHFTAVTVIIWEKADENNLHLDVMT
jgi:hypothetical protein